MGCINLVLDVLLLNSFRKGETRVVTLTNLLYFLVNNASCIIAWKLSGLVLHFLYNHHGAEILVI